MNEIKNSLLSKIKLTHMPLNFISIVILIWLVFRDLKQPNTLTYRLFPIIVVLILITTLDYLYARSSWYLKPLINQQYLIVYIWYEIPSFVVIFTWPFYKVVIQKILDGGFKNYFSDSIAGLNNKIFTGTKALFLSLLVIAIYLAVIFSVENLLLGNEIIEIANDSFRKSLLKFANSSLLSLLLMFDDIILYPLSEELFFRGYCYTALKERLGITTGIILSAIIFSLYHHDIIGAIPYFILGIFMARAYEQSKSLISPFMAHALYNILFSYLLFT